MKARRAKPSRGPRAGIVREARSRYEPGYLEKEDAYNGAHQRCSNGALCSRCRLDREFLRQKLAPNNQGRRPAIRIVDLFSGCGGMTVGLAEAARRAGKRIEIALALDADPAVAMLYQANFPKANARVGEVDSTFDGRIGGALTRSESLIKLEVGAPPDLLVGGPPCQGHSDLNNHTRRRDPKNDLYLRMARAAEVLKPGVVIIENVSPVQWDKERVVQSTIEALRTCGYQVAGKVLDLRLVGVPQRRRRFVLVASLLDGLEPTTILEAVGKAWGEHTPRTVAWAIEDLLATQAQGTYDTASCPTGDNAKRMAFLFENDEYNLPNGQRPDCHKDKEHSYVSVYGRLRWNEPAQTITTGFGCMGQGRYVHPQKRRTITPHEAARLQTFPDWFDFGITTKRGVLAKSIGNAVPPLLMVELGGEIIPLLTGG